MANIIEEQDPNKKGTSAQMLWSWAPFSAISASPADAV